MEQPGIAAQAVTWDDRRSRQHRDALQDSFFARQWPWFDQGSTTCVALLSITASTQPLTII